MLGSKRKHTTLTLSDKWDIIKKYDNGETPTALSRAYQIGRSTVYDLVANREKIENFIKSVDSNSGNRKTLRNAEFPEVEEALMSWFRQQRSRHAPISGDLLKEKAKHFYKQMTKKDDFKASEGWLDGFKKRFGIRFLQVSGEKLSADETDISNFQSKLEKKIAESGLSPDQVFNADETGLNWRQLPSKTFVLSDEKHAPGRKLPKERLTVMVCANASGNFLLKLLVVGKSKNPRAFKNIKMDSLPVHYMNQPRAWVTQDVFYEWFSKCFVPAVKDFLKKKKLPQKALLLLDNAPGHPDEETLNIKTRDGMIEVSSSPRQCPRAS